MAVLLMVVSLHLCIHYCDGVYTVRNCGCCGDGLWCSRNVYIDKIPEYLYKHTYLVPPS